MPPPAFHHTNPLPHTPAIRPAPLVCAPRPPHCPYTLRPTCPSATAAVAPGTPEPPPDYQLAPGEVAVRFINTPGGTDVIAAAHLGDALLRVGDGVGISIPRACQSGLCASCTCDVVSAEIDGGRETVRACQTGVAVPEGANEMVVDVARMKSPRGGRIRDPMARFNNLDTEYVAGAPPRKPGIGVREVDCSECSAQGDVECYACDGAGVDEDQDCMLCGGTGSLRCAECQGTGRRQISR